MNEVILQELEKEHLGIIQDEQSNIPILKILKPSEILAYESNQQDVLIGDCHIMRGEVFVIGGTPGVGKSRAAVGIGIAGATGESWMGFEVKTKFKTMIIQNENGRYRLKQEFSEINIPDLDEWLRVSEPPPYGLTINNPDFQKVLEDAIGEFQPGVVILDPWNAACPDDKQKDYAETFHTLRSILPKGEMKPALGVVAHTRKPQAQEKKSTGRNAMHLLAGSYVLASVPRSVFILLHASDDESEQNIVLFNPKNNNGQTVPRSAWRRKNGLFEPVHNFDWEEFDASSNEKKGVKFEHLEEVFKDGVSLKRSDAVEKLKEIAKVGKTAAYEALKLDGKFGSNLKEENGLLFFSATTTFLRPPYRKS